MYTPTIEPLAFSLLGCAAASSTLRQRGVKRHMSQGQARPPTKTWPKLDYVPFPLEHQTYNVLPDLGGGDSLNKQFSHADCKNS